MTKKFYMIAGANGAGKSIYQAKYLPNLDYIDFDTIERDNLINQKLNEEKSFGYETTLSSKLSLKILKKAKDNGFEVNLIFIKLNDVYQHIDRVAERVKKDGHHTPKDIIERRYWRRIMVDIHNLKNQISPTVFYSNEFQNARFISTGSNWVKVLSTCPFHQDKNPGSFHINTQNGAFHCFACGEKGDMIKFFMNKYNLGFKEAITKLRERYL